MNALDPRITELEIQVAHQNRTIEELSAEMARQGGEIDRLRKTLKVLAERFLALEEVATPRPEITKPPHY
ncbi:SlyX family protein [Aureimonas sp. AU40]|uniref:SlyX family protein n=1 Tax=Aureimonas sp. AU40 TaxID=1637747 RepID=UPI000783E0DC|nr:SlyX family protein [Aureimonas sp. AU40]